MLLAPNTPSGIAASSPPSLISLISIYKTGLSVSAHTVPKQGPGWSYSFKL